VQVRADPVRLPTPAVIMIFRLFRLDSKTKTNTSSGACGYYDMPSHGKTDGKTSLPFRRCEHRACVLCCKFDSIWVTDAAPVHTRHGQTHTGTHTLNENTKRIVRFSTWGVKGNSSERMLQMHTLSGRLCSSPGNRMQKNFLGIVSKNLCLTCPF
jgi:hypothetical protein